MWSIDDHCWIKCQGFQRPNAAICNHKLILNRTVGFLIDTNDLIYISDFRVLKILYDWAHHNSFILVVLYFSDVWINMISHLGRCDTNQRYRKFVVVIGCFVIMSYCNQKNLIGWKKRCDSCYAILS